MALFSFLFTYLGRKAGSIIQAIFGWSITALFGKLPQTKQLAVTVALALSVAWPIFVLGMIVPGIASWAIAFLPVHDWLGPNVLRIVWAALAVLTPPIVGVLTRWAAPIKKGSTLRAMVQGYPLALGYFGAFVVTAITVPLVKLAGAARGWTDTHVYVQPKAGAYRHAVRELALAAARAGVATEIVAPPTRMTLATKLLRFVAKGLVGALVDEELCLIKGENLEMYAYPADLLIRGKANVVARVRAMLTRTELDDHAYVVESEEGKRLQDELGSLSDVVRKHEEKGHLASSSIEGRLAAVYEDIQSHPVAYEEWVLLENLSRALERRIVTRHMGVAPLPLDKVKDGLEAVTKEAHAELAPRKRMVLPEDPTTSELIRDAVETSKELAKLEIALAKNEVVKDAKAAALGSAGLLVAGVLSLLVLLGVCLATVLFADDHVRAALLVAGALLLVTGAAVWVGVKQLPRNALGRTKQRLRDFVPSGLHQT